MIQKVTPLAIMADNIFTIIIILHSLSYNNKYILHIKILVIIGSIILIQLVYFCDGDLESPISSTIFNMVAYKERMVDIINRINILFLLLTTKFFGSLLNVRHNHQKPTQNTNFYNHH